MNKNHLGPLLLTALTVLYWLRRKQAAKKAATRQARIESVGYVPVSPDDEGPDTVSRFVGWSARAGRVMALVLFLFLMSAVVAVTVTEPLVRWILAGTLAAMALIVAVWFVGRRVAAARE